MQRLRYVAAFVYGFVLSYFVVIWLAGFMAARQVPAEYFGYFAAYGQFGREAALALLSLVTHFIPTLCLLSAGLLLPAWLAQSSRRQVGIAALAGALASYAFWLYFYSLPRNGGTSPSEALLALLRAPWWALPAVVGPLVGFVMAYALFTRLPPRRAEA
jgi:hypothetical protein